MKIGTLKNVVLLLFIYGAPLEGNIFDQYPQLHSKIPYILLGKWPTAVKKLEVLSEQLGPQIYFKNEGDCGTPDQNGLVSFGGNKVRKLEFLLADAISKGYNTVLTYGGLASNHVVATACYAQKLGLTMIGLLFNQHPPANISRNLLLDIYFGAHLFLCPQMRTLADDEIASFLNEQGFARAYVIPVGGSNILGVLGIVNAVFELRDQVAQGILPEPDVIYVPFGSMGTTAGLMLGTQLAGLKTRVCPVKVTNTQKYNAQNLCALISDTNNYLHNLDESICLFDWNPEHVVISNEFVGQGYAYETTSSQQALALIKESEYITLDQTYTAKALDALICDCKNHTYDADTVILFWNSYCSYEYPDLRGKIDFAAVPEWMHPLVGDC